jgi:hypothetical protein
MKIYEKSIANILKYVKWKKVFLNCINIGGRSKFLEFKRKTFFSLMAIHYVVVFGRNK